MSSVGAVGRRVDLWSPSFLRNLMNRDHFFAALCLVGCVNGVANAVITAVKRDGWWQALFQTFGISALIWLACGIGVCLLLRHNRGYLRPADLLIGLASLLFFAVPIGPVSWLAVACVAGYVCWNSSRGSERRRGALILLAATVPMIWTPLLFIFLDKHILNVDAFLVSLVLGSQQIGNVVAYADGSGYLQIYQGCSSFHNVSLAFVAWTMISQYIGHEWSFKDLGWYFSACLAVILVNVARVSLIGFYPTQYDLIHGPVGAEIAGWLTLGLIVGISLFGVRREIFVRP